MGHIIEGAYLVLVSYFSYVYLIGGDLKGSFALYAGSDNYLAFVIVGGMLHLLSVSMIMNISRALMTEWREGTLESLLLAPAPRLGYFIGTAVQQLYRCGLEVLAVLAFGLLAGLHLPHLNPFAVSLGLLLYLIACAATGLALGCVMLYLRDTYYVQNTFFAVSALLCGFQFPRPYLPEALEAAGQLLPLTSALQALRGALLTGSPVSVELGWETFILSALYALLALAVHGRIERKLFDRHR